MLLAMADQEDGYEGTGGAWGAGGLAVGRQQGGGGFDCDSLERCIDEFFHEVGGWAGR